MRTLEEQAQEKLRAMVGDCMPFVVVPVADLGTVEPPSPAYWWEGMVPAGHVTLLGAHGGVGKGWLALMLAMCVALGLPLFNIPTRRGRVAIFSAEDAADLLRYRLRLVCRALGVNPADLESWLHVLDATGGDPVLFHEIGTGARRNGASTPALAALEAYIAEHAIDLAVIDNASDVFDASEIDRARVRAFMRALARLARLRGSGVILLAHVDKTTARGMAAGSDSYSGSTAWNNSARSRLYLSREKDGALLLEHQKHNLGRMREPLRLVWPDGGIPTLDAPVNGFVQAIAARNDTAALLRLIVEFSERGEFVSTATTSRTHAGKLLRRQTGFPPGLPDHELFDLLRDAERAGYLSRVEYRGSDRKPRERWEVTSKGRAVAGLAATAATAATSGVTASGALAAEPAATAATSPPRGVGGRARTQVAAPTVRRPRGGGLIERASPKP